MKKYILSLDQGTSSSRAVIYNDKFEVEAWAQTAYEQHHTPDGWVEQDAMQVWKSLHKAAVNAIKMAKISPEEVAGIGISNQRETVVLWDRRTGKPLYNAISWQCLRTADYCEELKSMGLQDMVREKTGLVIDAYFSATKLKWIMENVQLPDMQHVAFGTIDSWVLYNLTGGRVHATDYTNASRTMLFNIHTGHYDEDLLRLFGIDRRILPDVLPNSGYFGTTDLFGASMDILGSAGDQQSALIGQGCVQRGNAKNTYGTGCFILMNTGKTAVASKNGLLTTIAYNLGGQPTYALEGSVFNAGSAIQWLRDDLGMLEHSAQSEELAMSVQDTGGVYVVPALSGLGAPYWDMYARGTILGLTRGSTKSHIVRATLEAIAFQSYDVLVAMAGDANEKLKSLVVDGGACVNNFLMQFQSDLLGVPVRRPRNVEVTALGAAFLAGMELGMTDINNLKTCNSPEREFSSTMDADTRDDLLEGWRRAIERSMNWAG